MKTQMEERIVSQPATQLKDIDTKCPKTAWRKVKLGEVCVSIADGDHQAPPKAEKGVPFVTISNIDPHNCMDFTNTMFVTEEYYNKLDNKRKPQKNDVLYSVVGSFGKPVFVKEDEKFVFQRHIAILRPNKERVNPMFMYYTMLSKDFYHKADAVALGAAQRTISLTSLRNMEIALPPRSVQDSIATTLSRYDALIANYQRQIKLLEEAAQRLYKEWFVDLRFPGHESVKVTDGVPEGWEKKRLGEIVKTTSGGTPNRKIKTFYNGTIKWVKTKELQDNFVFSTEEMITEDAVKMSSAKIIPSGSILMAMYGATIGKLGIITDSMACNQACCAFLLEKSMMNKEFLYCWLFDRRPLFISQGKGVAQPNLSQEMIKSSEILLPNVLMLQSFSSIIKPLFDSISTLQHSISLLTESRDRLLPKLMSGEIEL